METKIEYVLETELHSGQWVKVPHKENDEINIKSKCEFYKENFPEYKYRIIKRTIIEEEVK